MKTSAILAGLAASAATAVLEPGMPQHLLSNPEGGADANRIPTSYESAVMGRRILAVTKLAELATVFPTGAHSASGGDLSGMPIGLMDYVADCEDEGNPTILAITIATSFKNVRAGSNISLSMHWVPPFPPAKRISLFSSLKNRIFGSSSDADAATALPDTVPYSAANLPRFSLLGYLEKIPADPVSSLKLAHCFVNKHPDSKYWLPGSPVHESEWVRFVVTSVYWIGGFGDRAYIGWIPLEEWQKVTKEEYESIELPGEKRGWKEWSVNSWFDGKDL